MVSETSSLALSCCRDGVHSEKEVLSPDQQGLFPFPWRASKSPSLCTRTPLSVPDICLPSNGVRCGYGQRRRRPTRVCGKKVKKTRSLSRDYEKSDDGANQGDNVCTKRPRSSRVRPEDVCVVR